ncbi:MAG: recombinase family protein [Clostridia bacterium]|nr:recombinase family protein [Clostridia bacterium]
MERTVAIYARVSTEHESQLSALENQVQYYDNILAQHPEWKLYKRYIDEGITGTSTKKRKNFMKMLEDAKNGCFDLIITREVSRFARNTVDTLQETRNLKRIGVEVYFSEDNIWTFNDDDGELKLTIMATLAQNESKKISQRVKAGQTITFQNGVFYGNGNILGYDYNKFTKEVTVNEEQAEIVKFIYSEFLKGEGSTSIKYKLEERGYVTPTGLKQWSCSYIVRILQNPFYCGTIVYRKSYIPDYLEQKAKKNKGQVEQIIVEGKHESLVSKEDFDRVQEIIKERRQKINEHRDIGKGVPKNVWSKKLVCNCGSKLNKMKYHKQPDGTISYCYQCYKQRKIGSTQTRIKRGLDIADSCNISVVQEWKLIVMANIIFNTIWNDKERIIDMANQLIEETIKDDSLLNETNDEIKYNESKITSYKAKLDKLVDMYLNDMIDKENYLTKKEEFEKCIKIFSEKNDEIKSQDIIPKDLLKIKLQNLKQNIIDNLNYKSDYISEDVVDMFVKRIVVREDKFDWKLNYLNEILEDDNLDDENIDDNDNDIFLTRIVITKDDIDRFLEQHKEYKFLRLKEPIKVDIYL